MKRILPYSALSEREVPEAVDFRILARAAARSRARRIRRRVSIWGGIAAAVVKYPLGSCFGHWRRHPAMIDAARREE